MCQWKSAIASKSGEIYHHPLTDSHNDLIALFKLHDGKNPQFTPVKFLPGKDWLNVYSYKLKFDAERPDWADNEWVKSVSETMRTIIAGMIVNDKQTILVGGAYLFGPKAEITKVVAGRIVAVHKNANLAGADLARADLAGAIRLSHPPIGWKIVNGILVRE